MKLTRIILPMLLSMMAVNVNAALQTIISNDLNAIDAYVKNNKYANTSYDFVAGDHGTNAVIEVDKRDKSSIVHGLLAFSEIFGTGVDQVAFESTINNATLSTTARHNYISDGIHV